MEDSMLFDVGVLTALDITIDWEWLHGIQMIELDQVEDWQ